MEFPVIIPLTTQVSPAPSVKLRLEWVYGYRCPDLAPATASGPAPGLAPGPGPAPASGPSPGTSLNYAVTLEDVKRIAKQLLGVEPTVVTIGPGDA